MPLPLPVQIASTMLHRPARHRYGADRNQVADLWLPRGTGDAASPPPVAVLLHGGYWRTRYGKLTCRPLARRLAQRGHAVWNVEYRRVGPGPKGGGGWPATFLDVAAGVDALAEQAAGAVDLTDVTVFGHSAGGQLALWVATRAGLPAGAVGSAPVVAATRVVALSPVVDLPGAGDASRELMGSTPDEDPESWAQADPMRALPPPQPTLVVHPTGDRTIPVARSRRYVDACRSLGADVTLVDPEAEGHREVITPGSRCWTATESWLAGTAQRPNR